MSKSFDRLSIVDLLFHWSKGDVPESTTGGECTGILITDATSPSRPDRVARTDLALICCCHDSELIELKSSKLDLLPTIENDAPYLLRELGQLYQNLDW